MNLKQVNLNLLKAFDVLIDESNVTRASQKLHITQAAMSNTLNQLRQLFDDPLFIRQPKGMTPTTKALQLAPKIKVALATVEQIFVDESFDPHTSDRSFRIAVSSYCEHIFLPKLIAHLATHAPGIKINLTHFCASTHADLALKNDIDMVIGPIVSPCTHDCSEALIAKDKAVCIMSREHPLAKQKLTLANYRQQAHVAINLEPKTESTFIDRILAEQNLTRHVVCTFTQIIPALLLIKRQPHLIGTFPNILCYQLDEEQTFVIKQPPFHVPTCEFKLRWHQRFDNDPAHLWLREQILAISKKPRCVNAEILTVVE